MVSPRFREQNARIRSDQELRDLAIQWAHDHLPAEERQAYIDATEEERKAVRAERSRRRREQRWARDILAQFFRGEEFAEERRRFEELPYAEQVPMVERHKRLLRERAVQAQRERVARQNAAEERAEELLEIVVGSEEYERWKQTGEVRVTGSEGGEYRVLRGYQGNVDWYENGVKTASFCAHPRMKLANGDHLPYVDAVASQVLALMHDEFQFIATANVYNTFRPTGGHYEHKQRAVDAVAARRRAQEEALPAEPAVDREAVRALRDQLARMVNVSAA